MQNKLTGIDRNEEEAIKLAKEFYAWRRRQKIKFDDAAAPYIVISWMLDRLLAGRE